MMRTKKTWREKCLAREENGTDGNDNQDEHEAGESSVAKNGEANTQPDTKTLGINMVFLIPAVFRAPEAKITKLCAGAERAVFERSANPVAHMKPLYIRGHLEGTPLGCMMVDGGASVNILPLALFEMLEHKGDDLKQTNMSLSGFSRESAEAKDIISKELTVGSKMVPTYFFVVDVKGQYNVLLGRDWIHANECVPSTLHQCVMQWVGDKVEVIKADETTCMALVEA
jgi:hypothetical protein